MDCNNYSYTAPGFGVDPPAPKRQPVEAVTILRRTHNGRDYYIIRDGNPDPVSIWWTKDYSIDAALKTVKDCFENGI